MAFDGTEGGSMNHSTAADWTENYRDTFPNATKAHFFGKDIINDILNQSGCMGIRIYYAIDDKDKPKLILVGADANEADMIASSQIVADFGMPCPSNCDNDSSLNG